MHLFQVVCTLLAVLTELACGWSLPRLDKRTVAQHHESNKLGAAASESAVCSRIGVDLLKHGGNAADALVGTVFCVGVIGMYHSGIGGGGFMLVRSSNASYTFIDFRETAPAAAFQDMYNNDTNLSISGGLARYVIGCCNPRYTALMLVAAVSQENFEAWSIFTATLANYRGHLSCNLLSLWQGTDSSSPRISSTIWIPPPRARITSSSTNPHGLLILHRTAPALVLETL